jgi:two-component system, chemotaxis family, chemotaxis protein CheY
VVVSAQPKGRKTVVVVDDDVDIREILADMLVYEGFDVATAANGLEALKLLQTAALEPSLILLDLMMPVMDGYGFLEQRSSDPRLASIPIAIITAGHGVDSDRLGDGVPIVPKPFDVGRLLGIIRTLASEQGQWT